MAATVIAAFNQFQKDVVNLDSTETARARGSRDWLLDKIKEFPEKYTDFPLLYDEQNISYGSFARRTKIRPLDDIDTISCLHATGGTYNAYSHDDVRINVPCESRLSKYCHGSSTELNSRKIINIYINALSKIAQYRQAEINRRGEAATLQLNSYDWNFDIVPAFHTSPESDGRTYYLIPNGCGHWKKTDPRIDRERITRINRQHDGNMLNVLRCVKYWQRRPTMVSMPSYLLETIVVNYFEAKQDKASEFVDLELANLLRAISRAVLAQVADPKNIQADINDLSFGDRLSICQRATADAVKADEARYSETVSDMKESINKWREIFGDEFPRFD